ncbi:hypothetical protein Tco_0560314, partial [Tanacetum coccineum]
LIRLATATPVLRLLATTGVTRQYAQDIDVTAIHGNGYGTYDYASVSLPASLVPT